MLLLLLPIAVVTALIAEIRYFYVHTTFTL